MRADRLAEVKRPGDGTGEIDGRDGRHAGQEGEVRDALMRRLADLPPWHPSAIRQDKRGTDGSRPELAGGRDADDSSVRASDRQPERGDSADRGFWSQVSRFHELWRAHVERWPEKQDKAAEPVWRDDPPGSWRGVGDRHLGPEDNAEADKQIALLRKPEEAVTRLLKQIEHDNPHGAVLVGLERRLKGVERLKEKIADKMRFKGLDSPADAAGTINDAVRYTFCVDADEYAAGHAFAKRQLETAGCRMTYRRNHWVDDPDYRGINSRWTTSDGGRFELQFHTRESFYAKEQLTHDPYQAAARIDHHSRRRARTDRISATR